MEFVVYAPCGLRQHRQHTQSLHVWSAATGSCRDLCVWGVGKEYLRCGCQERCQEFDGICGSVLQTRIKRDELVLPLRLPRREVSVPRLCARVCSGPHTFHPIGTNFHAKVSAAHRHGLCHEVRPSLLGSHNGRFLRDDLRLRNREAPPWGVAWSCAADLSQHIRGPGDLVDRSLLCQGLRVERSAHEDGADAAGDLAIYRYPSLAMHVAGRALLPLSCWRRTRSHRSGVDVKFGFSFGVQCHVEVSLDGQVALSSMRRVLEDG
mmetsp:Transcript_152195/g.486324  ORF Transcript_152195/g.486324 Transcript_152195/m.486324 type:complete len:264 (+) Transcript_152195:594-1385(+)